jgi:hypothetical protein
MKSKKIFLALGFLAISSCQNNVNYKEEVKQTEPVVQEEKKESSPEELFGKMCTDDKTFNGYSQSIEKRATEEHPYFLGKIYYEVELERTKKLDCNEVAKKKRNMEIKVRNTSRGVKSLKEYVAKCNEKKAEKINKLTENIKLTESGKLPANTKFALQIDKTAKLQKHNADGVQDCCKQAMIYNPDDPTKKVPACYGIGNYKDGLREVYYIEEQKVSEKKVSQNKIAKKQTVKKSKNSKVSKTKKYNKTKKRSRKNRRR